MTYTAKYILPTTVNPSHVSLTEPGTLHDIVADCVEHGASATLYNEPGFVVGYVKSDGQWSLR